MTEWMTVSLSLSLAFGGLLLLLLLRHRLAAVTIVADKKSKEHDS
jgi:hypothetical protein